MRAWLESPGGNPSSLHGEGRAARRALEDAREAVAAFLGGDPARWVFTSGATEANNMVLRGARPADGGAPAHIAVSAVEHPSVSRCAAAMAKGGVRRVTTLPVDAEGTVSPGTVSAALEEGAGLVVVMAGNNEVGTVQEWRTIADLCRAHGALLHVDAVQAVGKVPFDVEALGAHATVSISAHKIGGPQGTGALWLGDDVRCEPWLLGGGQERDRRAGTENVAGAIGLGAACRVLQDAGPARGEALRRAERMLLEALRECVPDLAVHGPPEERRLPGLLSVHVPGVSAEALLFALDLKGVAVSMGSACSSGAAQPSAVLAAMGVPKAVALQSLRISLGSGHAAEEVRRAATIIGDEVRAQRSLGAS